MGNKPAVVPILKNDSKKFKTAERSELVGYLDHYKAMNNEWLRRQILVNNRIDILAVCVLGYHMEPMHSLMMRFQFLHPDSLQLAFRGAGKSTTCTIAKGVHYLLKDPNFRILIASKSIGNAQGFLKEIKGHFESNEKLAEVFGLYYDPRKVNKWNDTEIEVLPRTSRAKEASVTCVSVEGTIVSKHYDAIISDDLIDEDNSRTQHMRDKVRTWYYQTLEPTLEPPDDKVPHRGEHHRLGTRYHYADLYGHLIENEMAEHHNVIPALKSDRSPWPDKYPPEWFDEKKKKSGTIIFNAQYQCDTEAMKGEIFQYDDCQKINSSEVPDQLRIFMGVDLAISQEQKADHFAIAVIGVDTSKRYYVLDWYDGQLRFGDQTKKIVQFYNRWEPIRCCIETNGYQKAQYQNLKDGDKDIRLTPKNQDKDKIARAWKLSSIFEDKRFFFKKIGGVELVIEQLVLFPSYRYKDFFDALDLAVMSSRLRKRRRRRNEPGII